MAQWMGTICDPSSEDFFEPVGESGVKTPSQNGAQVEYYEELPPLCARGPAR